MMKRFAVILAGRRWRCGRRGLVAAPHAAARAGARPAGPRRRQHARRSPPAIRARPSSSAAADDVRRAFATGA